MQNAELRIEPFTLADISEASWLTMAAWSGELVASRQTKQLLYEGMVRYYYRNENYSYKISDGKGMQAFLLAGLPGNAAGGSTWWGQAINCLSPQEQELVQGYHAYLAYNGQRMEAFAGADDLLLHLFISRRPGCGQGLLTQVEQAAGQRQKKGLLLWTDETCNYAYYRKNGFRQLDKFPNSCSGALGKLQTLIYRKNI